MVARKTNLSPTMVQTIFDEHVQIERKPLSEAICMDEFYFSRKAENKYACLLINFKNGMVIDALPSRRKANLRSYFRNIPQHERERVKYVSMDLYDNYRDIAKTYLPHALICADRFHIMKIINNALNRIRCDVMNEYSENKKSDEYYLLKHKNNLLFKNSLDINDTRADRNRHFKMRYTEGQILDMILEIDSKLKQAYDLKELYCIFCEANIDMDFRKELLETVIAEYKLSDIEYMRNIAMTLENWKEEIVNSFHTYDGRKLSNGPIEGRNRTVKIILRLANGYTNFNRFRNRVLYVLNKYETYSEKILDVHKIRKTGTPRKRK